MATRKKRVLTPEEQLEAALVPKSEWPYEVPDNWCWTRIHNVAEVVTGNTPSKKQLEYYGDSVPFFKPADLDAGRHVVKATEYLSEDGRKVARIVPAHSTAVCCIGSIGKCGFLEVDGCTNQQINTAIPKINPLYLYYFMTSECFTRQLWEKTSATTISIVNKGKMSETCIPLPPLHEQRRIASRIEWLFAKLDDAEAELREVIDGSEQRQAAILHKAFTGKLSESWRKTHNVNQNTWTVKRFDEVASIRSNLVDPATYAEYPHIAPDNIEKKTGVLLPYHTIGEDGVTSGKHHFYPGQILYSKIRPYLSKAVVVDFEGLCSADMYPIEAMEDTRYLWHYILSEDFLEQTYSAGSRTVLPKINQKGLSAIKVPIPTEAEQRFISEALDTYFERSHEAESQAMEALQQIQDLRQSILEKALRGKLGTNDPDEPSSKELLASIASGNAGK